MSKYYNYYNYSISLSDDSNDSNDDSNDDINDDYNDNSATSNNVGSDTKKKRGNLSRFFSRYPVSDF